VTHVGCWAHARRNFFEAGKAVGKGKRSPTAEQGLAFCDQLFRLEKKFAKLTPEKRKEKRLEQSKPVLDALFAWAETRHAAPKSALGKALNYVKNQREPLTNFLLDGMISGAIIFRLLFYHSNGSDGVVNQKRFQSFPH
jgi:hypothetical protein